MGKYINIKNNLIKFLLIVIGVLFSINSIGQETVIDLDYTNPQEYVIGGISISGADNLSKSTLIQISELEIGETIIIPGNKIKKAIKKLWDQGLFSNISIDVIDVVENNIFLTIYLKEHVRLSKFKFEGKIRKSEISDLKEKLRLMRGKILTKNLITNCINTIKAYYIEKGYLYINVKDSVYTDTTITKSDILVFNIEKGKKIKIKKINITGRSKILNTEKRIWNNKDSIYAISNYRIKKIFEETKEKKWWRIFKSSKFIESNYEAEKKSLIAKYNEKGYRDARILNDSIYKNNDNTISIEVNLIEGEVYTFGKITWIGNTIYDNETLTKILKIKQGDIFNQSILDSRISGGVEGKDISSLYMDDGYLFFRAHPIEISTENNEIDFQIRIKEGEQARINKVSVTGNTKTNDHVIMREIRTRPGDLFKRNEVIRSQRELAQLQYFDPEQFDVQINPDPVQNSVDITYQVAEKSTDQINLQGGWGGGYIVGSLGLRFTNFSSSRILKKNAWDPIPAGDGQTLSLSASSNGRYYQSYNISFVEPWLGGKKPNSFSISAYRSLYSLSGSSNSQSQSTELLGGSIGLGKRLKYPDDYFTLYNGISIQHYKLENSTNFIFQDGMSNNISYTIRLGRNSVDQLVFPRSGSNISLSLKATPPYSILNPVDNYANLTSQEKYAWIEYYKWKFKSAWFSAFTAKLVLNTNIEMGLLGSYNDDLGLSPFERFYVGGDGLSGMGAMFDGREMISLRGYNNNSISPITGASIYNKYTTELRYALSLNPSSTVYILSFLEAGNAWDNYDYFNPFGVKRSAGFGIRIMLPMIGMMGVDYGWGFDNIPNNPNANGGQFHFSIGQQF
ncbi:MAG: outer membrane protein assembly factor BamA [Bacteroidota bacterium]|nr:outer membrane protein assembly factor BamA [Bacteroidota bacterium]